MESPVEPDRLPVAEKATDAIQKQPLLSAAVAQLPGWQVSPVPRARERAFPQTDRYRCAPDWVAQGEKEVLVAVAVETVGLQRQLREVLVQERLVVRARDAIQRWLPLPFVGAAPRHAESAWLGPKALGKSFPSDAHC